LAGQLRYTLQRVQMGPPAFPGVKKPGAGGCFPEKVAEEKKKKKRRKPKSGKSQKAKRQAQESNKRSKKGLKILGHQSQTAEAKKSKVA